MIDFSCKLYGAKTKRHLLHVLKINKSQASQKWISDQIVPRIDYSKTKPRLIEAPQYELKQIQKRIKDILNSIEVPDYVFSGIKKRSFKDNAEKHILGRFLYKTDFTGFFPTISRDCVYKFFRNDMNCSADIAEILTSLTTVDLSRTDDSNIAGIYLFLQGKGIQSINHLGSGFPTSPILSYLVNYRMFEELRMLAEKYHSIMTVYIDDITFSSIHAIPSDFRRKVSEIVEKYHYIISKKKSLYYKPYQYKLITGVIITPGNNMVVKNSLRYKTIKAFKELKKRDGGISKRSQLQGLVSASRYIDPNIYPSLHKYAYMLDKETD